MKRGLACAYTGREKAVPCGTLILVTGRIADDELFTRLAGGHPRDADRRLPQSSHIADAVFSGHRFAREFGDTTQRRAQRERPQAGIMPREPLSRRRGRPTRTVGAFSQRPWKQFSLPYEPIEILSADNVARIHDTALTILEEIGMKVLEPRARDYYARAGAKIEPGEDRVRFDRAMIEELIAKAPAEFTLEARNPAKTVKVGKRNGIFSSVGGPAYVMDLEGGRRAGTYAEMCDYLKVVQASTSLHQEGGGPFEPLDLPADTRHLDLYFAEITLLDKNWQPQGLGTERSIDALEMAAISLGTTREGLIDPPVFTCIINTNSPLQLDIPMAEGLMTYAEHGQCVVVTPFTLGRRHVAGDACRRTRAAACRSAWPASRSARSCGRGRPSCMAASPPMSTCAPVRPPSARPNMRRPRKPRANWRAISACRSAPAM